MVCSPHSRRVRRFRAEVVLRSCQELEGRTGFLFYFSSWQLPVSSAVRCVAPEPTVGLSLVKDCSKIKHPCFSNVGGHFDRFVSQGSRVKRAEMQKQRFSCSFHERSRYLRAQGAEPHRGVVGIMPPTDLLREPGWHTQHAQCYRGTSRDPGYSKVSCSVPASHRKQFGMKDEGRPRCLCRLQRFIGNSGLPHCCPEAATAARSASPPKTGAALLGAHTDTVSRAYGSDRLRRRVWECPISGTGRAAKRKGLRCRQRPTLRAPLRWRPRCSAAGGAAAGRPAAQGGAEPGGAGGRRAGRREALCRVPAPRRSPRTRPPCAAAASRAAPSPGSSRSRSAAIAMSFLL